MFNSVAAVLVRQ